MTEGSKLNGLINYTRRIVFHVNYNADTQNSIVKSSFSAISLGFKHHNRWLEISGFSPPTISVSSCCSPACLHRSDESSLRSEAVSTLKAADHKQASTHFPFSSPLSVCQCWRQSVVSVASPSSLERPERCRLIDELRETSNTDSAAPLRVPSVPDSRVGLSAQSPRLQCPGCGTLHTALRDCCYVTALPTKAWWLKGQLHPRLSHKTTDPSVLNLLHCLKKSIQFAYHARTHTLWSSAYFQVNAHIINKALYD